MRGLWSFALVGAACTSHVPVAQKLLIEDEPGAPALPTLIAPVVLPAIVDAAPPEDALADPVHAGEPGEDLTPLQRLLGDGVAEAVEIEATQAVGRERLVLFRYDGARAWRGKQAPDKLEEELERLGELVAPCIPPEDDVGEEQLGDVECAVKLVGDRHLAWDLLGFGVFAWELARTRPGAAGPELVARTRLYDETRGDPDGEPTKFKVYDVDGDRRSEATVVVSVRPPFVPMLEDTRGQVAFVVDSGDLHLQFSATRSYYYSFQDVSASSIEAETVWLARDVDGDGHADLQVRETVRESFSPGEEDEGDSRRDAKTRKTICPYDQADDMWRCSEALGRQLFDDRRHR
jgi:hypothetical protein